MVDAVRDKGADNLLRVREADKHVLAVLRARARVANLRAVQGAVPCHPVRSIVQVGAADDFCRVGTYFVPTLIATICSAWAQNTCPPYVE